MSKQRSYFGSEKGDGVSYDFLAGFLRSMLEDCVGLDLCDVNFDITESDCQLRSMDYDTFRDLFEYVVESIHGSHLVQQEAFKPIKLVISMPQSKMCPKPKNTKL